MSHLGDLTSALVDGELAGAELDRANAHLAACSACQAEAAQLRRLKSELRALADVAGAEALTRRLLAMPGPRTPGPSTQGPSTQGPRIPGSGSPGSGSPGRRDPLGARPLRPAYSGRGDRRRGRYVVLGAVSLVVAGVGAAAFGMGGSGGPPERPITPQLEMLDLQHAASAGDVPFTDPRKALAKAAAGP